jgi:hypothetical protein
LASHFKFYTFYLKPTLFLRQGANFSLPYTHHHLRINTEKQFPDTTENFSALLPLSLSRYAVKMKLAANNPWPATNGRKISQM